jgi:hypothetical protein
MNRGIIGQMGLGVKIKESEGHRAQGKTDDGGRQS